MTHIHALDRIQRDFGRRILRMPEHVANEYVFRELHLESMHERIRRAQLNFFGHLCRLGDASLAGYIFRKRCEQLDAGGAGSSWREPVKHSWICLVTFGSLGPLPLTGNVVCTTTVALISRASPTRR